MNQLLKRIKGFVLYDLGLLEGVFKWKTAKYLKKYYLNTNITPRTPKKTIIYMLDGRAYSGGISDVLRGMISMFHFSKEIGYDFKINFCFPYRLSDYYAANKHNWEIEDNDLSFNPEYSAPFWLYSTHLNYGKTREYEIGFQRKLLKRFIQKNESICQFHIYTNSDWVSGPEYSLLFNELFKPSISLLARLDAHKKTLGDEYVSMTFRFQQLLGDFIEKDKGTDKTQYIIDHITEKSRLIQNVIPDYGIVQLRAILGDFRNRNISIPLDEADNKVLIETCIKKIVEIRKADYPALKVLVTSDSEKFLNAVRDLDFVHSISNTSVMETNKEDEVFNIFLKAYVDIHMIADARKIFLLVTGPMYRSGFAKNASFINNREYDEVIF